MKLLLVLLLTYNPLYALIYIYDDNGVWPDDVGFITEAVRNSCPEQDIKIVNAAAIKAGVLTSLVDCFIGPGGADVPFHTSLGEDGMNLIKAYVLKGGRYLGLCASGYFGSKRTIFFQPPPASIIDEIELGLATSIAVGPTFPYDGTRNTARVIDLMVGDQLLPVYYNGGGCFIPASGDSVDQTIAFYKLSQEKNPHAIIHSRYGLGQAILTGVHPELCYAQCLLHLSEEGQTQYKAELNALWNLEQTHGKYYLFKILLVKLGLKLEDKETEDEEELSFCEKIGRCVSSLLTRIMG